MADTYNNNVAFLLKFESSDLDSSNFVLRTKDEVTQSKSVTKTSYGNATLNTSSYKFGTTSFNPNGSLYEISSSPLYNLYGTDFTFEGWFNFSILPTTGTFHTFLSRGDYDSSTRSYIFSINTSGSNRYLYFQYSTGGTSWTGATSTAFTLSTNTWYHFAYCRSGTTLYYFLDGVGKGTTNLSTSIFYSAVHASNYLGGVYSSSVGYRNLFNNGSFDEFRLTPGIARYTSDFTPPSSEFEYSPRTNPHTLEVDRIYSPLLYTIIEDSPITELDDCLSTKNAFYGGAGTITGKVTKNGQPFSCNVTLMLSDFQFVDKVLTDPATGIYTFSEINTNYNFLVCAIDNDVSPNYGAKIQKVNQQTNIEFNDQNLIDLAVFYGTGTIYGTVKNIDGDALERRVVLLDSLTYKKIKTLTSNSVTGEYEFTNLDDTKKYVVVAEDTTPRLYNDILRIATA